MEKSLALKQNNKSSILYQNGVATFYMNRQGWKYEPRPKKPLLKPTALVYEMRLTNLGSEAGKPRYFHYSTNGSAYAIINGQYGGSELKSSLTKVANNRYYFWFKHFAGAGASTEFGTTLVEAKQSLDMISRRFNHLVFLAEIAATRNVKRFVKALGLEWKRQKGTRIRRAARSSAALWFEYWFGWAPLLDDIFKSLEALTLWDEMSRKVETDGSAKGPIRYILDTRDSYVRVSGVMRVKVKGGATVTLSNPNAYLMNQLGLANPALIAWNITRYTWLLNWITDVNSILESFTDFMGLTITDYWESTRVSVDGAYYQVFYPNVPALTYTSSHTSRAIDFRRSAGGMPTYKPRGLFLPKMSISRAASASSLLIQKFIKIHP